MTTTTHPHVPAFMGDYFQEISNEAGNAASNLLDAALAAEDAGDVEARQQLLDAALTMTRVRNITDDLDVQLGKPRRPMPTPKLAAPETPKAKAKGNKVADAA